MNARRNVLLMLGVLLMGALGVLLVGRNRSGPLPAPSSPHTAEQEPAAGPLAIQVRKDTLPVMPDEPPKRAAPLTAHTALDGAREVLGRMTAQMRDVVADAKRFPELAACRAERRDCSALEYRAADHALAWPIRTDLASGRIGYEALKGMFGPGATSTSVHSLTGAILTSSRDPLERMSALALLEHVEGKVPPLPSEVYQHLGERPPEERALLLAEYVQAPVPLPEIGDQLQGLAIKGSPAESKMALAALGNPAFADQLGSAVEAVVESGPVTRQAAVDKVAPPLAACGARCLPTLESLATSTDPGSRLSALIAITRASPSERPALMRQLLPAYRDRADHLTAEELTQLRYLGRLVKEGQAG